MCDSPPPFFEHFHTAPFPVGVIPTTCRYVTFRRFLRGITHCHFTHELPHAITVTYTLRLLCGDYSTCRFTDAFTLRCDHVCYGVVVTDRHRYIPVLRYFRLRYIPSGCWTFGCWLPWLHTFGRAPFTLRFTDTTPRRSPLRFTDSPTIRYTHRVTLFTPPVTYSLLFYGCVSRTFTLLLARSAVAPHLATHCCLHTSGCHVPHTWLRFVLAFGC